MCQVVGFCEAAVALVQQFEELFDRVVRDEDSSIPDENKIRLHVDTQIMSNFFQHLSSLEILVTVIIQDRFFDTIILLVLALL